MVHGEERPRASFRYKKELTEWVANTGMSADDYEAVKDVQVEPVANALSNAKQLINKILLRTSADDYQMYLTGKDNYREDIATIKPYKGNRDSSHKPHHYESLKRYLIENWGALVVEGIEADDQLSIDQYNSLYPEIPEYGIPVKDIVPTTIATIDKDLNCTPGWHYNWNQDTLYWVSEEDATTWFYCQMIIGDTTDNIVGVPGAGKKKAYNILSQCEDEEDMYWAVLDLYQAYYSTIGMKPMDALIENGRLLWMQREEGEMWNPPV